MIMLQGCGGKMAVTSKKSKCKNYKNETII